MQHGLLFVNAMFLLLVSIVIMQVHFAYQIQNLVSCFQMLSWVRTVAVYIASLCPITRLCNVLYSKALLYLYLKILKCSFYKLSDEVTF